MIVNVVQVDVEGLAATEETVKVDIGDVTWETLVLKRVVRLESLRLRSGADLVEAAVPRPPRSFEGRRLLVWNERLKGRVSSRLRTLMRQTRIQDADNKKDNMRWLNPHLYQQKFRWPNV